MRKPLLIAIAVVACVSLPASASAVEGGTLTVKKNVAKAGHVGDGPNGKVSCGPTCESDSAFYADDCAENICIPQDVIVSATAEPGWKLTSWTNCFEEDWETNSCWAYMSTSKTITANFTDIGNPAAAITAPGNNTTVRGTIGLAADASDNDGVKAVQWLAGETVVASDATAPYAATLNTATLGDGTKTISARAIDNADLTSALSSRTIKVDNTAPGLGITAGPAPGAVVGVSRDVGFQFSSGDASTVECRTQSSSWISCDSKTAHTLLNLPDGAHTFSVRAVDAAGNAAETSRGFTMDATAPAASITGGDAEDGEVVGGGDLVFAYQVTDEPSGVQMAGQCALDDAPFAPCETTTWHTVKNATEGEHTIRVRGVDAVGNVSAQSTRTFTVDLTGPQAQITGGTAAGAKVGPPAAVAFQFAVTDAKSGVAAVQCALDGGAYAACDGVAAHALSGVAHGPHTFKVRGVDAVGNAGPAATRTFEVDVAAPETTIDTASTGAASAFTFSSSEPASTFACRLYAQGATAPAFGACAGASGSHSTSGLALGTYVFEVVATDAVGNTDGSPAGKTFTVSAEQPPPTTPKVEPEDKPGDTGVKDAGGTDPKTTTTVTTTVTTTTTSGVEKLDIDMTWEWTYFAKGTRADALNVTGIAKGVTIELHCKAKGCPFKKKAFAYKKGTLKLARQLKRKLLKVGGTLEVRAVKPGAVADVIVFKMRKKAKPSVSQLCLAPGAAKPGPC